MNFKSDPKSNVRGDVTKDVLKSSLNIFVQFSTRTKLTRQWLTLTRDRSTFRKNADSIMAR
jgi:hypothetical protein